MIILVRLCLMCFRIKNDTNNANIIVIENDDENNDVNEDIDIDIDIDDSSRLKSLKKLF